MHSNGFHLPKNYNPADFYIKTLALIPTNKEECMSNIKVSSMLNYPFRELVPLFFLFHFLLIVSFFQRIRESFLKSTQLSKLSDDLAQADNGFKNNDLNLKITNKMT